MREQFINMKVESESAKKSYDTLFKRIDEHEYIINKKVEQWNKKDCLDFLTMESGSNKYNTLYVKWSLLKKYLIYINNTTYREIRNVDLRNIEDNFIQYFSRETVINTLDNFNNYIDKAIIVLLRNGVKGNSFEELANLKSDNIDIENNKIILSNRTVVLNNYDTQIIKKAMEERGYHMNINKNKKISYTYYHYNLESEYFLKNRPNKFNNEGLDKLKPNAIKDKVRKIITKMNIDDLTTTSLVVSYAVDRVIEFEKEMNMTLTEKQVRAYIDKLGIKINSYSVYTLKNNI